MTLTELKYIVAVARERHFGRAADACFVAQPTLSMAIKKLEDELDLKLFERGASEVSLTALGEEIVRQAQMVLDQAAQIKEIARRGKDPLAGPLRLGVIYTIAPYLLPELVGQIIARTPQMPLMLHENFTVRLLEMLRAGEVDCAIMAEPFADAGLAVAPLYDEPFVAAVPSNHALAAQVSVSTEQLRNETMLLLGAGHCFRDHVLQVCPEFARFSSDAQGIRRSFEGSSLETIKHMVAAGMGVTLVPRLGVPAQALALAKSSTKASAKLSAKPNTKTSIKTLAKTKASQSRGAATARAGFGQGVNDGPIRYLPLAGDAGAVAATRRVVLAWRRSFTRYEAIAALRNAIYACALPGVQRLS